MSKAWRNFIYGIGTLACLNPPTRPPTRIRWRSFSSDAEALRQDWEHVGQDLSAAMRQVDREIKDQRQPSLFNE